MTSFDAIADLPLEIESCEFEGLSFTVGGFERLTTVVRLHGGGHEGLGEDVTYDAVDHIAQQDAGAPDGLRGAETFAGFSERLDGIDLFPAAAPERDVSRPYRRWAFESAALDLALRQAGTNLAAALGREPRPVKFVNSMRLSHFDPEERDSIEPLLARLAAYPDLRFKLDPTNDWDDELIAALVETGAVDSLDLKGFYKGTPVDVETDPELYAKLIEAFPASVWLEDPDVTEETRPLLDPVSERVTWDAPIHSIADIEAMPWSPPRTVNLKPSRFGPIRNLFAAYDYCEEKGIGAYGGGQLELGQGRGQIQYLASIFHPDTPNDVAPSGYNDPEKATKPGLPISPLAPAIEELGFRWVA